MLITFEVSVSLPCHVLVKPKMLICVSNHSVPFTNNHFKSQLLNTEVHIIFHTVKPIYSMSYIVMLRLLIVARKSSYCHYNFSTILFKIWLQCQTIRQVKTL